MKIRSALQEGSSFVYQHLSDFEGQDYELESIIFLAMNNNPYKSEKAQKDFIAGVSDTVNCVARRRWRRMNGGQ